MSPPPSSASTTLPTLLRGCITWREERPWVDHDALLVVADWCEENGMEKEAEVIRVARSWALEPNRRVRFFTGPESSPEIHYDLGLQPGRGVRGVPYWAAVVSCACDTDSDEVTPIGEYTLMADEAPIGAAGERLPTQSAILRLHGLACWHCICHMLGWPPLRLVGEG